MKHVATMALLATVLCTSLEAQVRRTGRTDSEEGIYSRTIIHPDDTRTVSKQDINNKIREKRTLDKNGILLMRSIFQLNQRGKAVNGLVYDGRNRLLYRSEFTYDEAGRLQEERVFDASGNPVRRLVYKADRFGKIKPFALSFYDGRKSTSRNLEGYSTASAHAYRGGGGVANTPTAYRGTPTTRTTSGTRTTTRRAAPSRSEKRKRRFQIFKRK